MTELTSESELQAEEGRKGFPGRERTASSIDQQAPGELARKSREMA